MKCKVGFLFNERNDVKIMLKNLFWWCGSCALIPALILMYYIDKKLDEHILQLLKNDAIIMVRIQELDKKLEGKK